jgi:filamentous hemagglutinin family protein
MNNKKHFSRRGWRHFSVSACFAALSLRLLPPAAFANPTGLTVANGSASLSANGNQLNITASQNAILNWQSFNIGHGETTTFIQPSAQSIVWNRINDANPSQIYGSLNANGVVVLMNHSGFYFGPNSYVNAAGLVVSTASLTPSESSAGLFWQFNGAPPAASIINYGQLNVGRGGSAFLIAEKIENHGSITAPEGEIGLFAGKNVLLSQRPDGLGLSASVSLPSGSVDNFGRLTADGGAIALHAQVVNQNGLIQANSVREKNGIIELLASDSVNLGADSVLTANGAAEAVSAGGRIIVNGGNNFTDVAGSQISVRGGGLGGNGGFAEVSADNMSAIHSRLDGQAAAGSTGGRLLIDPNNITIGFSGAGDIGSGTVDSESPPVNGTLTLNVFSAFLGFAQIDLQARNNITIGAGVFWDLANSTGISDPGSWLRLEAGNNLTVGSGASIVGGPGWSVSLEAGRDFNAATGVRSGVGNITFAGSSSLATADGGIHLLAGNNITVNSGFVHTTDGGSITARALAGNINTGGRRNSYLFGAAGATVDTENLGGISTANGGDVTLLAGGDVTSYLPTLTDSNPDDGGFGGGSGAFGPAAGNVTIAAGGNVSGHYAVANGTGRIFAGVKKDEHGELIQTAGGDYELDVNSAGGAGTPVKALALSLVSGGWTVNAARDILLQEVRNPNGLFNDVGFGSSTTKHYFDYSDAAYVTLNGGNSVQLLGESLPRYNDFEKDITPIYPGTLTIHAGAGGVVLGNDVTLFGSPLGNLSITTTAGGSLVGSTPGGLAQLVVSDSSKKQFKQSGDFGAADHAAVPLHLNDAVPVRLDIAGDMSGILLVSPKRAEITVGGDMVNSRLEAQNLHAGDVTSIHVGGDIRNRNEFTSVVVVEPPRLAVFDLVYPPLPGEVAGLGNQFFYNATTHELTFQGRMTGAQLDALLNLRVRAYSPNGLPILDANGQPVTVPAKLASDEVIQQLYAASQDVPINPNTGYLVGGGGTFNLNAHSLDLGSTLGIVSQGPRGNAALANYFTRGADVNVTLAGNLEMFSTKIASFNGGEIKVNVGGYANIGSRTFLTSDQAARGVFTTDLSDVTFIAGGNINVNGSRIAAYDGGNVTVRSLHGNVDAGTGISGAAAVEKIYVDPVTRKIYTYVPTIPGSGILATTFPPSLDPTFPRSVNNVGNILVETPEGNITASAGGVVQIPLNGVGNNAGTVTLRAGTKDANGNVIHVGNIDASGSGVIGSNVKLEATGDIKGLVFARGNLDIAAQQNVNVTALAIGSANVNAGDTISGTIIGVGSVNVSGATIDAALLSQNVSASGDLGSSQVGFAQANAAGATSQGQQNIDGEKVAAKSTGDGDDELNQKKNITLAQKISRVTVILPVKK